MSERFKIRDMAPRDRAGKGDVHSRSWHEAYTGLMGEEALSRQTPERCREIAERHPENTLVAVEQAGERVVGFSCYLPEARPFVTLPGAGEVTALYVLREYQGLGLGRRLLESALCRLPKPTVALFVLEGNDRAVEFYKHMGFRFTGFRMEEPVLGRTAAELEMVLRRRTPAL